MNKFKTNDYINWILHSNEDRSLQVCKTLGGKHVIRRWTGGVASIVSSHGYGPEGERAAWNAFATLVGSPEYCAN